MKIWVAIPTSNWNGRLLGTGGGGFSGGNATGVNQPIAEGYATGATDTGHEGGSGSFALGSDGKLNWESIRDSLSDRAPEDLEAKFKLTATPASVTFTPLLLDCKMF